MQMCILNLVKVGDPMVQSLSFPWAVVEHILAWTEDKKTKMKAKM